MKVKRGKLRRSETYFGARGEIVSLTASYADKKDQHREA